MTDAQVEDPRGLPTEEALLVHHWTSIGLVWEQTFRGEQAA
jgi:hypothetical protein